jgi:hypothetical protein
MGFFDSLVPTEQYQAQTLAKQSGGQGTPIPQNVAPIQQPNMAPAGLPGMQPQGFAKGGLAAANSQIEQTQIKKVFEHYFMNMGADVNQGMKDLEKQISQGLQLIPFESSVMGYKPLGTGIAQIHFFTVGTMKDLADDMQYFFKYLKDQGVRTVYDTLPAPITTQMLVKMGAKVEESDNPKYKLKATI